MEARADAAFEAALAKNVPWTKALGMPPADRPSPGAGPRVWSLHTATATALPTTPPSVSRPRLLPRRSTPHGRVQPSTER